MFTGEEDTIEGVLRTAQLDTLSEHASRPRPPEPGDRVGRYVVLSTLGAGGMGMVFAAYDPELDRKVAIKLVRPHASSSTSRERMVREARSMAQLSHANVVSVFDAGEHDGAIFIAMEFVAGTTLGDHLPQLQGWSAILEPFIAAAHGLAAAHERGLIHRDFKPDNVMVGDDGSVRVMDFGLARREGDPAPSEAASAALEVTRSSVSAALGDSLDPAITQAGTLMGTPAYMAPEQFRGGEVDERADQFAVCVALWEALFGERPFRGEGIWDLATAVNEGRREPIPRGRAVPRWLTEVLDRGLASDPSARWPSMNALLRAIDKGRARRRNRWIALAVASPMLLGAAGYGGHQAWAGQVAEHCEAEARAAMPWPSRARALEEGMLSTSMSFAAQSFDRASETLDQWSDAWVELRSAACLDGRVTQALAPAAREAQVRCLDSSTRTTEHLLDVLESGDSAMLVFAVDNVALVSNIDPCRDPVALSRRPRPRPEVQAEVEQAEDGLNEMTLLYMSGHLEEALLIGHASLERLERTGFAEGIADAKSRVGSLLSIAGRHAAARTMLEQAYFSAGAMKDDEVAAAAARHLAGIGAGPAPHGIEWVRGWASHASMLHARLGMSSSFEEAEVHESLAAALADVDSPGSQPEEIELIGKARDIRASLVGEDHPAVLVADINLAVYAAQEDPHVPLDRIRSAGKRLRLALGPGHPTMVSMHLMTGGILAERGQLTEALADMDRAITLSVDVNGPDHPQTMRAREIREEVMALRQP